MRNQLVWQDRYNIGIDFIDREHKKLFSIINRLFAMYEKASKSQWVCQEGIKYFKDHAMKHFTEEEAYMASIEYSGFELHRRMHDDFRQKTLPALEQELVKTGYSSDAIDHFLGVCAGWLIGHTMTEDRAISGEIVSKWANLMPEEERAAMRQTTIQFMRNLFQLDLQVISEYYGGEKFESGIYYRIVYANQQGKEWEIILVFEEKLLVNTIGSLICDPSEEVNVMMVNATRYTARQFAECIRKHFPSAEQYEMKSENLLTHEQIQKIFESRNPQCSFLFDTGVGYLAYSFIAPHITSGEMGISIKAENAMDEISKYLKKDTKQRQKKILVVDDSKVMCQAMRELFGNDYEVSIAQSGLAAIRTLVLNRPDLILLDYEMPVCDGKQVLEMIRADHDIADIPVIFLTGKVDRESIKNVMALKPAGYLSKTLKPVEIKKSIDAYFDKTSNAPMA